jgi:hypothetical protein
MAANRWVLVLVVLEAILKLVNSHICRPDGFHAVSAEIVRGVLHVFLGATQRTNRLADFRMRFRRGCCRCVGLGGRCWHGVRVGLIRSGWSRRRIGKCYDRAATANAIRILVFMNHSSSSDLRLGQLWVPRSTVCAFAEVTSRPGPDNGAKEACSAHESRDTPPYLGHLSGYEQQYFRASAQSETTRSDSFLRYLQLRYLAEVFTPTLEGCTDPGNVANFLLPLDLVR